MPFCDVDLVDEIARTPAAIRFHGYRLRPMLRDMAKKYLPEKVVKRTKRESMIPIGRWFCNELRDYVESQFTRNRLPAIVDFASVQSMWEEHKSGRADHGHVLWAVLLLGHWLRKISGKHRLIAG
jgi:asparagine synthase (glutamine-hydrolysing)